MFSCRLKYLIYAPILCSSLAFISLGFWYLAGCSTQDISTNKLLNEEIAKNSNLIQQRLITLKAREERQNNLLNEIETLKLVVQRQIDERRKRASVSNIVIGQHTANLTFIYGITPTYTRLTQKAELTRLCQTFLHLQNFHWIIVEDSETKTDLVAQFLQKCGIRYTHLAVKTGIQLRRLPDDPRWLKARGVEQRNAGLKWLRENIDRQNVNGVVYFIDDDNTYDLEIFKQMRFTKKVSIWPVGLVGGLKWEGPICKDGKVVKFRAAWGLTRPFTIDMAGFAVNLKLILDNPSAIIDTHAGRGHLESSLLKHLVTREELEPLADNCSKILVWHTQTMNPKVKHEKDFVANGRQEYEPMMEV